MVISFSYSLHAYRGPEPGPRVPRLTDGPQGVTGGWAGGDRGLSRNQLMKIA